MHYAGYWVPGVTKYNPGKFKSSLVSLIEVESWKKIKMLHCIPNPNTELLTIEQKKIIPTLWKKVYYR